MQHGDGGDQAKGPRLERRAADVADQVAEAGRPTMARSRRVSAPVPQPTSSAVAQPTGMASRMTWW
jgi:hypothetical protein